MMLSARRLSLLLSAALLGLSLASLTGCKPPQSAKKDEVKLGKDGKPVAAAPRLFLAPVLARRVQRGDVVSTVSSTGTVMPIRSRLLRAEEAGRLRFAKDWKEGDFVTKGELIARIESESLEGDLRRGEADVQLQKESLDIARKSMDNSVKEYATIQDLYSRGISPKKEVDTTELSMQRAINTHRQAVINLEKAEASLRTLRDREQRLELFAPYDGLLVARTTLDGTKPFATAFGTEIITDFEGRLISNEFAVCGIIDVSQVVLRSDVTSRDIAAIRTGQEAFAMIYTGNELRVSGTVIEIGRATSADTRAFQVDILVENPNRDLRPGMFGRVEIVTEKRPQAIALEKSHITRRNNRDVVFVVEQKPEQQNPVAREVPVEIGLSGKDFVEITWGIKQGDAVITKGVEMLQDQTPIAVLYEDDNGAPITPAIDGATTPASS